MNWSTALPAHFYVAALALGYGLGSIPFGLLLTQLAGTADIRSIGSGNIGATNVLRTGRKGLAAATLLCDILKGAVAALIAGWLWGRNPALVAGFGAFLGHLFPVWLRFKGGKGVATYIGVLFAVAWPVGLVCGAVWLLVAAASRYSSLASLTACAVTPAILWAVGDNSAALLLFLMSLLVFAMHRANIGRLMRGEETKIGKNASSPAT